jgi:hypothetical protein
MTKLSDLQKVRDELNIGHDIDLINCRFFSPFQGMAEMYALQKGVEAGFEKGFDSATSIFTEREKHLMSVIESMKKELSLCSYDFKYICNQKNIALKVDNILAEVNKMMGEL